jgi:hypothetical protein
MYRHLTVVYVVVVVVVVVALVSVELDCSED